MPGSESPIFARSYQLLRWLIPLTLTFPRQQRFVLAAALQQSSLRLHEHLIVALHSDRASLPEALVYVDVDIDTLRHYLRLCHDLELLSIGQYEHASSAIAEIGRLLGGWRKGMASTTK